jgi:uncharacterized membrane protein YgcG
MQRYFLLILLFSFIQSIDAQNIPEAPKFYTPIYDGAKLLNDSLSQDLKEKMIAYEDTTSTQIVFAIIDSLHGKPIQVYSQEWAEGWGIGQKGADNGLLVLISQKDRLIRFEVGYGLEAKLTDSYCNQLIEELLQPNFRSNNYLLGLEQTFDKIAKKLTGEFNARRDRVVDPKELVEEQQSFFDRLNGLVESYIFHLLALGIAAVHLLIAYLLFYRRYLYRSFRILGITTAIVLIANWIAFSTKDVLDDESFCFLILFMSGAGIFILELILLVGGMKGGRIGRGGDRLLKALGNIILRLFVSAIMGFGAAALMVELRNDDAALPTFLIVTAIVYALAYFSRNAKSSGNRYSSNQSKTYSNNSFFNTTKSSSGGSSYSTKTTSSYSKSSSSSSSGSSSSWGGGSFGGGGATGSW